ncbi:MAG: serine protease [Alphaproteobacteria bacterium]|nr:serine protease [Alphaproteobacteria bacterium]
MADDIQDPLALLSEALVRRAGLARSLVAGIAAPGHRLRSGVLLRKDVVVASEQAFPDLREVQVTLADASRFTAQLAGRDPGTNIAALRLDGTPDPAPRAAEEPRLGTLAVAFAAGEEGLAMRLGAVHSVGPVWHSRAGGRIDRRIMLDMTLTGREEGGPVLDAGGGLLGMSTLGPRGRVLVIPRSTIEDVLEPLLSKGRVDRGWLGMAVQPVVVPEALQSELGQSRGLMVMDLSKGGPADQADLQVGDILVAIGGERLTSPATVAHRLGPDAVGQQIELRVIRSGKLVLLSALVGVRPSQ